jgi:hypothetical protein
MINNKEQTAENGTIEDANGVDSKEENGILIILN